MDHVHIRRSYSAPTSPDVTLHGSIGQSTLMSPPISPPSKTTRSNSDSHPIEKPIIPYRGRVKSPPAFGSLNGLNWTIDFTPFGQQKKDDSSLPILTVKDDTLSSVGGPEDFTENMEKYINKPPERSPEPKNEVLGRAPEIDVDGPSDFTANIEKYIFGTSTKDESKSNEVQEPEKEMRRAPEAKPVEISATGTAPNELIEVEGPSDFTENMIKYVKGALTVKQSNVKGGILPEKDQEVNRAPEIDVKGPSDFTSMMKNYVNGPSEAYQEETRQQSSSIPVFEGKAPEGYTQYLDDLDGELTEPVATSTPQYRRDLVTPSIDEYLALPKQRLPPRELVTPQQEYTFTIPKQRRPLTEAKDDQITMLRLEVEQLKSQLRDKEALLVECGEEFDMHTGVMGEMDGELHKLRKLNEEHELDVDRLETEADAFQSRIQDMEQQNRALSDTMKGLRGQKEDFRRMILSLEEENNSLLATVSGLKDDRKQQQKNFEVKMFTLERQNEVMKDTLDHQSETIADLEKRQNVVVKNYLDRQDDIDADLENAELQARIGQLEKAEEILTLALEKFGTMNTLLRTKLRVSQAAKTTAHEPVVTILQEEVSTLKSTVDGLHTSHAATVSSLQSENRDLKSSLDTLRADHVAAFISLQSRNTKLKISLDALRATHNTTVATLQSEIRDLTSTNDALRSTMVPCLESEISDLKSTIDGLHTSHEAAVTSLQFEIKELKSTVAALPVTTRSCLESEISDLKSTIDDLHTTHAAFITALQSEILNLKSTNDALKANHTSENDVLRTTYVTRVATLESEVANLKSSNDALKATYASKFNRLRKTHAATVAALETRISDHVVSQDAMKVTHASEADALQNKIEELKEGCRIIFRSRDKFAKMVEEMSGGKMVMTGRNRVSQDAVVSVGVRLLY